MKKLMTVALALVLVIGLIGCGKDNTDKGNNNTQGENNTPENTDDKQTEDVFDKADASMDELKKAVVDVLGENYWPNTAIPAEMLEGTYGISADMYDEFLGETPMISANVDTLLIIKAKADKTQEVADALNAYRDNQIENGMHYPMNVGKVHASRIETFGNYVCFVQLGADISDLEEQGDEAIIEYCQQENEKALDAIEKTLAQ